MKSTIKLLKPYFRGLPLILALMVGCVILANRYLRYVTPMYESTTKIKLADLQEGVTANNLFQDLDVFSSKNKTAVEIEVIKSQTLIEKVIDKLDFDTEIFRVGTLRATELYDDRPFVAEVELYNKKYYGKKLNIMVLDNENYNIQLHENDTTYSGIFGQKLEIEDVLKLRLSLNKTLLNGKKKIDLIGDYAITKWSKQGLYRKIYGNLDVVAVDKDVAVVKIIYKNNRPEKAALLANTLAKTYIEDYIESKYRTADVTANFLDNQIKNVYEKLSQSEDNIENYKEEENIINLRQETETDLRKIAQLKIQQTNVKMSLDAITELDDYVQKGKANFLELAPNFEAFTDLLSTEMVKKIKELQIEKTELLLVYKPQTEEVKTVERQIDLYKNYFLESITNTRKNLEIKYKKLCSDIESSRQVFKPLPKKEKALKTMDRDFRLHEKAYIFLNEKKIEAEIARAAKIAFHRIITKAEVPRKPISPNTVIIKIVAGLLGLFGGLFLMFLYTMFNTRVEDIETIEQNSDIEVLYAAPHLRKVNKRKAFFQGEALRMEMQGLTKDKSIISFTSLKNGQGANFHAQELAQTLNEQNRKTVLVNIDKKASEVAAPNTMHIDTSNFKNQTYAEMQGFFNDLKNRFDVVLINNEQLKTNFISTVIMKLSDKNLFVLDSGKTYAKEIASINLARDKYEVGHMAFILNNEGYRPWLPIRIIKSILRLFKRK